MKQSRWSGASLLAAQSHFVWDSFGPKKSFCPIPGAQRTTMRADPTGAMSRVIVNRQSKRKDMFRFQLFGTAVNSPVSPAAQSRAPGALGRSSCAGPTLRGCTVEGVHTARPPSPSICDASYGERTTPAAGWSLLRNSKSSADEAPPVRWEVRNEEAESSRLSGRDQMMPSRENDKATQAFGGAFRGKIASRVVASMGLD
eukprot:3597250-Prymnesium_polylepis.1